MQTKVKELMKANPVIIAADATLQEAAEKMKSVECGVLPVGRAENIEGIITDRDIVIRAVADGADTSQEQVRDYMTSEVFYCNENDTLEQAAAQMRENNVSRLVVKDINNQPCGILTFGNILRKESDFEELGRVVECVAGKAAA